MPVVIVDPDGSRCEAFRRALGGSESLPDILRARTVAELSGHSFAGALLAFVPGELVDEISSSLPDRSVVVLGSAADSETLEKASRLPQVASIIASAPSPHSDALRAWEVRAAIERLYRGSHRSIPDRRQLPVVDHEADRAILSTAELQDTVAELESVLEDRGVDRRLRSAVCGVAHEMIMNSLYDAPIDSDGKPLYAYDRTKKIQVPQAHAPLVRWVMAGTSLFLRVTDPFGGLTHEHVYGSLRRGALSSKPGAHASEFIDTSHGGAGLGIHRIVTGANAVVFDVIPGGATTQLAYFDLSLKSRDRRRAQRSLHFYSSATH